MRTMLIALLGFALGTPTVVFGQSLVTVPGRVVDGSSSQPVRGVAVEIPELGIEVYSDSAGEFTLQLVTGSYTVLAHHFAFQPLEAAASFGNNSELLLEIYPRPFELDGIDVQALQRADRAERGSGSPVDRITPEEMEEMRHRTSVLLDVLRMKGPPRLRISQGTGGGAIQYCIESTRARPSVLELGATGGGCRPVMIVLGGIIIYTPPTGPAKGSVGPVSLSAMAAGELLRMSPEEIESVEFLAPTQAFFRFGEAGRFGALIVEVRRGGSG